MPTFARDALLACLIIVLSRCAVSPEGAPRPEPVTLEYISAVQQVVPTSTPTLTATPTLTSTPAPSATHAPCEVPVAASAWVDTNANRKWDEGEPPLRGVRTFVDDVRNGYVRINRAAITDDLGEAVFNVYTYCSPSELELYAEAPAGFVLTTPERLEIDEENLNASYPFGFTVDEYYAPAAPALLVCEQLYHFKSVPGLFRFRNDQLWVLGARGRIDRLAHYQAEVAAVTPAGSRGSTYVEDFAIGPDGTIWVATWGGVDVYNGTGWRTFGVVDGLPDDPVLQIEVAQDGRVWAATGRGLAWFDVERDRWRVYQNESDPVQMNGDVQFVKVGTGVLWFSSGQSLYEYHPDNPGGNWWQQRSGAPVHPAWGDPTYETLSVSGERFWFLGLLDDMDTLGYIDISTHTSDTLNVALTTGAMPDYYISGFQLQSDATAWVGFTYKGLYRLTVDSDGTTHWEPFGLQHGTEVYVQDPADEYSIVPIAIDGTNHLWLTSEVGLSRCNLPS